MRKKLFLTAYKQRVTLLVVEKSSGVAWRFEKAVFNPKGLVSKV